MWLLLYFLLEHTVLNYSITPHQNANASAPGVRDPLSVSSSTCQTVMGFPTHSSLSPITFPPALHIISVKKMDFLWCPHSSAYFLFWFIVPLILCLIQALKPDLKLHGSTGNDFVWNAISGCSSNEQAEALRCFWSSLLCLFSGGTVLGSGVLFCILTTLLWTCLSFSYPLSWGLGNHFVDTFLKPLSLSILHFTL